MPKLWLFSTLPPRSNGQRSNVSTFVRMGAGTKAPGSKGSETKLGGAGSSCKLLYNSTINPNTVNPISMDVVGLYYIFKII